MVKAGSLTKIPDESHWEITDTRSLEPISKKECLERLPMVGIGRVAFFVDDHVEIFPVNYARLGHDVIFQTGPGTKLAHLTANISCAFEVDHFDVTFHTGWSIVIKGTATRIEDDYRLGLAKKLPLTPWAPGKRGFFIEISPSAISGRRIVPTHRTKADYFDHTGSFSEVVIEERSQS